MQPTVKFAPHDKQQAFLNAAFSGKYRYLFYGGAAGGGKTWVGLGILLMLCKIYPGSRWCVVRKDLPKLKLNTIPSFLKIVPSTFLRTFNQSNHIAYFANGSEIIFFPENYPQNKDLQHFDGLEVNGFLLEEAGELQEKTFEKAKLRAGRWTLPDGRVPMPLILLTSNPGQGWLKNIFYTPWMKGELPDMYYFEQALMNDNPYLDEEYIKGLVTLDSYTQDRYVKGSWEARDVQKPFAYFFSDSNIVTGTEYTRALPLILSFDFNRDPITCIAAQHRKGGKYPDHARVIREFRLLDSDIYELCDQIKAVYPGAYFLVTGDASGSNSSALVRGALNYYKVIASELKLSVRQIMVPLANPSIKNSRLLVNSILEKHPDFIIDESCQYLIDDLRYCEVDETGDIDKDKNKHMTHLLDCFRYYLNTFFQGFIPEIK
jgi:hypothetical protein